MSTTCIKTEDLSSYERDPRPDLAQDHSLWISLLIEAKKKDASVPGIFGILHCLRCGGARLEFGQNMQLCIRPGEWGVEQYEEYKIKYLRPNAAAIKELLAKASEPAQLAAIKKTLAVEPRLRAAGWTDTEIWHLGRFDNNGWWMESVYAALHERPEYEIGEITADYVELILRRSSGDIKHRLFRRPPGVQRPQLFADQKSKEAV